MRINLQSQLKIRILLFGIPLFLTNCQIDDNLIDNQYVEATSPPNVTYFSRKNAPENVLATMKKTITKHYKQKNSNTKDLTTSFGTVLTDRIMLSVSNEGIENYTFKVELDDNNPKTFFNESKTTNKKKGF